ADTGHHGLRRFETQHAGKRRVGGRHPSLRVHRENSDYRILEDHSVAFLSAAHLRGPLANALLQLLIQILQRGFRLLALGDVAKDRCEIEVLASRPVGDGYFHGKFLSVFFSGDQLERLADDSWLTGSDESPEAALVRFMEPIRHEQSQRL